MDEFARAMLERDRMTIIVIHAMMALAIVSAAVAAIILG